MNPLTKMSSTRRTFCSSLLASAIGAVCGSSAAGAAPRGLKITGTKVLVTNPPQSRNENFVLVKIETSEPGLYGWGDATCTGSEQAVAKMLEEHLAPAMIGRDPMQTENIGKTLYHLPY